MTAHSAGISTAPPSINLTLLLAMQAALQPNKPFLIRADGSTWTFQETDLATAHLAWLLGQIGLSAGDRVMIIAPNGDRAAIALAGLVRGGFQVFLAPPDLPFADGFAMTTTVRPAAIIVDSPAAATGAIEAATRLAAASASVRFVLGFGSGLPKGVMDIGASLERARGSVAHLQRADDATEAPWVGAGRPGGETISIELSLLLASVAELAAAARLRSGDRLISPLPLTDPAGLASGVLVALFAGCELALLDAPDSRALAAAFETRRACHLVWPAAHAALAAELTQGFTPLRSLIRRCVDIHGENETPPTLRAESLVDVAARADGAIDVNEVDWAPPAPPTRIAS